jgi:hypothetical protein
MAGALVAAATAGTTGPAPARCSTKAAWPLSVVFETGGLGWSGGGLGIDGEGARGIGGGEADNVVGGAPLGEAWPSSVVCEPGGGLGWTGGGLDIDGACAFIGGSEANNAVKSRNACAARKCSRAAESTSKAFVSGGGLGIDEEGGLGLEGGGAAGCWSVGTGPKETATPGTHPMSGPAGNTWRAAGSTSMAFIPGGGLGNDEGNSWRAAESTSKAFMSGGGLGIDGEGGLGLEGGGAAGCWSVGTGPRETGTPGTHPMSGPAGSTWRDAGSTSMAFEPGGAMDARTARAAAHSRSAKAKAATAAAHSWAARAAATSKA